jgi:hypothetical protein
MPGNYDRKYDRWSGYQEANYMENIGVHYHGQIKHVWIRANHIL